ncbi:hypothetical protein GOZ83_13055 [Agrobacterium vitis]|uniref:cytochrome C oxidase subunit IV family protein n=1 Tax=Rhizobium/Agrobacterium group TaxID=227290 RepID=UPI0012E8AF95|nr:MULTISPECIES: cytochrome C oxidase subunit IV family protein [Rhizobium/Agrobacterium group]MCF1494486.1 hypothetical protein [Allorhizobium ampelinum]MVA45992.1 hypothetical protein [Agrobacterium vitis]
MTSHSKTRLFKTWTLLLILSVTAVLVARYESASIAIVLALALVKCRLILLDFLALRSASPLLRRALYAWCLALVILVLAKILAISVTSG